MWNLRFHLCALLLLCASAPAWAITINVANNMDYPFGTPPADGDGKACSFRKALVNALNGNQTFMDCTTGSSGADGIHFADAADFTLGTRGVFDFITKDITITAPGPKKFIGISSGLGVGEIFHLTGAAAKLTMNDFTLQGAGNSAVVLASGANLSMNVGTFSNNVHSGSGGGAISGAGTVALTAIHFTGNSAPAGSGGAINLSNGSFGAATITDSFFDNNTANNSGGAIAVSAISSSVPPGATLTITNTQFGFVQANVAHAAGGANEGGGGIFAAASGLLAQVSVINSSFLNNKVDGTDGRGGAIYNHLADTLPMAVDHSLFTLNQVNSGANGWGGALYTEDSIVVRASSFIGNAANAGKGGAIASNTSVANPMAGPPPRLGAIIANSTIQGNSADTGAGLYSFAQFVTRDIQLINVTMDGNTAVTAAGGIMTEQVGAGTATTTLRNTIVSNNKANSLDANCGGVAVTNSVANLQWPGTSCAANTPIASGDPKLSAPFINPPDVLTLTMSLNPGSAASNAGDNATCASVPIMNNFDQRSLVFPIRPAGGANCDIGAYESNIAPVYASNPAPAATINMSALITTPATATVVISNTGSDSLIISGFSTTGGPQISVSGPAGPATPFTIPVGNSTQTLTLTCANATAGNFSGTLTVTHNAAGNPATYTVNCAVTAPLSITTASPLPNATVGSPYSQTFAATGGTPPYVNWAVVGGALPAWATLNAMTGALTGTPPDTVGSPFTFTIQVKDSAMVTATKQFTLTVMPMAPVTLQDFSVD